MALIDLRSQRLQGFAPPPDPPPPTTWPAPSPGDDGQFRLPVPTPDHMTATDWPVPEQSPDHPWPNDFPQPHLPTPPTDWPMPVPVPGGTPGLPDVMNDPWGGAPSGAPDWQAIEAQLRRAGGPMYDPSDLAGVQRNASNTYGLGFGGLDAALQAQLAIYRQRDPINSYGQQPGGRVPTGRSGNSWPGPQAPTQFTGDPLSKFLEEWANTRASGLETPPQGSGQALLEAALQKISGQLGAGGYTTGEQEIFQTQALDPLEQLRTARRRQVMEELSRRGISPQSGVAQSMLQDVDRQFDRSRTETQRSIAGQAAQEQTARLLQSLGLLGQLAGTQDTRMDKAFGYRSVPYNMSNTAFSQGMQLSGQTNPLSMIQPLLALTQQQQGQQQQGSAAMADLIWALMQRGGGGG